MANHRIMTTIHVSTWLALILLQYLRKYWNHNNINNFKDKSDVIPMHTMTAYGGVTVKVTHS